MSKSSHYTVVVIGTGFGGTMTALPLARKFTERKRGETILMLERGTWWTTPVGTVQDKEVKTYKFLQDNGQPVQFWSSRNDFRGFVDMFTRCLRRKRNEDGLYDFALLGRRGFLGLFGNENDGVSVIRASGVGGGSLVYSNITIRPPDLVFQDNRWPLTWTAQQRDEYYDLARDAIGAGVLSALAQRDVRRGISSPSAVAVNTGLSNIVTRSSNLDPHWIVRPDPANSARGRKEIDLTRVAPAEDFKNDLWIDRARLFQTALNGLRTKGVDVDYGAVDLAINDWDPGKAPVGPIKPGNQIDKNGLAKNYCERQGRCNVGCLPGARHTLNKQLMAAALGSPTGSAVFNNLEIEALAEVDVVIAKPGGGYEIKYLKRDPETPSKTTTQSVTADIVIVAAGTLGTSEILLRSKLPNRQALPNLSDRTGFGFSTNGDYLAFLDGTRERMRLTRGPVTTSFGHFNAGASANPASLRFHTLEDQGIPPAMATLTGYGIKLIQSFSKGNRGLRFALLAILSFGLKKAIHYVKALFANFSKRQDIFESNDEVLAKTMCVVAMGQEAAVGQFRLGTRRGETPLRVSRADGPFHKDPIYSEIRGSLASLAAEIAATPGAGFESPFLNDLTGDLKASSIALSHPLGGCRMAGTVDQGVVDEFGRVFDKSKGPKGFYKGLYVADGSIVPTALGVNPSLTITALSLRVVDNIIDHELPA